MKNNISNLLIYILITFVMIQFLSACNDANKRHNIFEKRINPTFYGYIGNSSANHRSRLDIIKQRNKLIVGIELNSKPFAYLEKGKVKGFEVDLLNYIAKELGVAIEFVEINNAIQYDYLMQYKIDIISSTLEHKIARENFIDFSITYFQDGQRVLTSRDSGMDSLYDIIEKKVIAIKDKNYAEQIKYYTYNSNITVFTDIPNSADSVLDSLADCVTGEGATLLKLKGASKNPQDYIILDDYISYIPYAFGLPESDSKWRDAVNIALIKCYKEKIYDEYFENYFGKEKKYEYPTEWEMEIWN